MGQGSVQKDSHLRGFPRFEEKFLITFNPI